MWFWTRNRRHYSIKTLETLIYELEVSRISVQQQTNSTYNKTHYLAYLFFQPLTSTLDWVVTDYYQLKRTNNQSIKMTKIFMTGSTGYIGGDAMYAIATAHPEYEITALVRNSDKGAKVAAKFPNVKLVYGDLDSVDVLERESRAADIVCRK